MSTSHDKEATGSRDRPAVDLEIETVGDAIFMDVIEGIDLWVVPHLRPEPPGGGNGVAHRELLVPGLPERDSILLDFLGGDGASLFCDAPFGVFVVIGLGHGCRGGLMSIANTTVGTFPAGLGVRIAVQPDSVSILCAQQWRGE